MVDQSVRACHLFRVLLLSSFVSDILLLYVLSSFTFFSHPHNSCIALPSALSFFLFTLAASLSLPFHSARFVLFHLYFYLLVTSLFVYSTDPPRFPSSSLLLAARLQTREKDEMKRERERKSSTVLYVDERNKMGRNLGQRLFWVSRRLPLLRAALLYSELICSLPPRFRFLLVTSRPRHDRKLYLIQTRFPLRIKTLLKMG